MADVVERIVAHLAVLLGRPERFGVPAVPVEAEPVVQAEAGPSESSVLEHLAVLTAKHGPWEAAQRKFNPINEEATHVA